MKTSVHIVNAFIDGTSGGNPAGVVLDADGLTPGQKLEIARQVGLSETAFVSQSKLATVKLEFFTPLQQIAHCGHATIATFALLRQLGRIAEGRHSKETIDGVRDIVVESGMAFMAQRAPTYAALPPATRRHALALESLRIGAADLVEAAPVCVANTGNAFLLVPLRDAATLKAIVPDPTAIAELSGELDLIGYYVFCRSTQRPGRAAAARMFAPRYGIAEESGTGMAAGPLACYLRDFMGSNEATMLIEQGWLMPAPSPSVIRVDLTLSGGNIVGLMAGGAAAAVELRQVAMA